MADNVINILVKSTNDTKEGFDSAKADAETAGDDAGEGFMARFASHLNGGGAGDGMGIAGVIAQNMGPEAIEGLAGGMLVVAPAIAAILVELVGVVNGLLAAGAGVGALALVAIPTFEKVSAAIADTPAQLAKQPKLIQDIVGQIRQLEKSFDAIGQSMMPQLLGIFDQGLGIAAQLMPVIATFAKAAAPAVAEVMGTLSKSVDSAGFKDFVDKLSKISGPAIEAIGAGFIKVAGALGHLMTVMSAHDVVHALNVAFDALADTINGFADWVHGAQLNWDNFSGHMQQIAHTITANFQAMMAWFEGIPGSFETLGHQIESVWDGVVSWFEGLPGKIVNALAALPGMLYNAGAAAVQHLIDGLGSKLGSLGSMAATLAKKIAGFFGLSPALEGPLSGSGAPEVRGQHFAADLARGMLSGAGTVGSAAGRLAGSIGGAPGGGSGGGGGGGQLVVTGAGAPQFLTLVKAIWPDLQLEVRTRGGGGTNSAQIAFGGAH